jgi:hypothetical protein
MSSRDDYKLSWSIFDEGCLTFGEDDEYSLVVVDLAGLEVIDDLLKEKGGRIHNVRPFFSVTDTTDPEIAEWDVCYMGWFRSVEEAQQYAMDRLGMTANTEPDTTAAPESDAPTTEAATQAPAGTEATTNATTNATTEPGATEGCASVVGFGAVAILAAAAAAVALKKKD